MAVGTFGSVLALRSVFSDLVPIPALRASPWSIRGSRKIVQNISRRRNDARLLGAPFFTAHRLPVRPRSSPLVLPRPWGGNRAGLRLNRDFWTSRAAKELENRAGTKAASSGEAAAQEGQKVGLLDRVKNLTKQYGSAALVVYLGYSAIDFSLTFLLIYAIGADHVHEAEDWALEKLHWRRVEAGSTGGSSGTEVLQKAAKPEGTASDGEQRLDNVISHGGLPERKHGGGIKADRSTLWTTAVLAYAIHKTLFLPLRVGLTAATTPRIVRALRSWGWNVGRPAPAAAGASALGGLILAGNSVTQSSAGAAQPHTG